jgi:shikimate dehydrogenase
MHNAAFAAAGVDAWYLAFDVTPESLAAALDGAHAMGIGGLNVTVPHKEQALALAGEADPMTALIGAANTLVPTSQGWKAFNTDAKGFLQAVGADLQCYAKERRCFILGAGGAARAAAVALAQQGAQEILVANRNGERAQRLCASLAEPLSSAAPRPVAMDAAPTLIGAGDLLVSATPLGLRPDGNWPWNLERFEPGVLVYDMAYRAGGETGLVRQARKVGLRAASGRSMLLHQGALAFTLWTGLQAPLGTMERALLRGNAVGKDS